MQGTSSEWEDQVRTQESGELGLSTDTRELKIGDGTSAFDELPTLLEVDNAETIKAALEGNATAKPPEFLRRLGCYEWLLRTE
jgi:hypothetical protein